jgi:hypothetical protein
LIDGTISWILAAAGKRTITDFFARGIELRSVGRRLERHLLADRIQPQILQRFQVEAST